MTFCFNHVGFVFDGGAILGANEPFIPDHTITASAGANGSIFPTGAVTAPEGSTPSFTITPASGYHILDVTVDGVSVGSGGTYTFSSVHTDHTIAATFAINAYAITASTGANGSIAPPGSTGVSSGGTVAYTFTPDTGYHIADVLVDGVSNPGAVTAGTYTFTGVVANHTISVSYAINTYTLTVTQGAHGVIAPSGPLTKNYGSSQAFSITPDAGYLIVDVLLDGASQGAVGVLTVPSITANHTITASFAVDHWSIDATAGAGGIIAPQGTVSVLQGHNQTFDITANVGYTIADVVVDGVSQGPINTFQFLNVVAAHTIAASFLSTAPTSYTVQASASIGGTVSPSGTASVAPGDTQAYTFTPNEGYHISSVVVDGVNYGAVTGYTFSNVFNDHFLTVTFELDVVVAPTTNTGCNCDTAFTPMTLLTKLAAVNAMLESVWESPVSTLEGPAVGAVAMARRTLEESSMTVQDTGWAFNTEDGVTLTPDVNGCISLPTNIMQVDSTQEDRCVDVIQRGTRLYNRGDHTYTFTKPIKVRKVTLLDFEEVPQSARMYIALMATRLFKARYNNEQAGAATPEEVRALANLQDAEGETGDYNMLTDSWSVASILER